MKLATLPSQEQEAFDVPSWEPGGLHPPPVPAGLGQAGPRSFDWGAGGRPLECASKLEALQPALIHNLPSVLAKSICMGQQFSRLFFWTGSSFRGEIIPLVKHSPSKEHCGLIRREHRRGLMSFQAISAPYSGSTKIG